MIKILMQNINTSVFLDFEFCIDIIKSYKKL